MEAVVGVVIGAFLGSFAKGHFRWEACEDPRELKRQCIGAVCMGFGAVLALGALLFEQGHLEEAEAVYREGYQHIRASLEAANLS